MYPAGQAVVLSGPTYGNFSVQERERERERESERQRERERERERGRERVYRCNSISLHYDSAVVNDLILILHSHDGRVVEAYCDARHVGGCVEGQVVGCCGCSDACEVGAVGYLVDGNLRVLCSEEVPECPPVGGAVVDPVVEVGPNRRHLLQPAWLEPRA